MGRHRNLLSLPRVPRSRVGSLLVSGKDTSIHIKDGVPGRLGSKPLPRPRKSPHRSGQTDTIVTGLNLKTVFFSDKRHLKLWNNWKLGSNTRRDILVSSVLWSLLMCLGSPNPESRTPLSGVHTVLEITNLLFCIIRPLDPSVSLLEEGHPVPRRTEVVRSWRSNFFFFGPKKSLTSH